MTNSQLPRVFHRQSLEPGEKDEGFDDRHSPAVQHLAYIKCLLVDNIQFAHGVRSAIVCVEREHDDGIGVAALMDAHIDKPHEIKAVVDAPPTAEPIRSGA